MDLRRDQLSHQRYNLTPKEFEVYKRNETVKIKNYTEINSSMGTFDEKVCPTLSEFKQITSLVSSSLIETFIYF